MAMEERHTQAFFQFFTEVLKGLYAAVVPVRSRRLSVLAKHRVLRGVPLAWPPVVAVASERTQSEAQGKIFRLPLSLNVPETKKRLASTPLYVVQVHQRLGIHATG